LAKGPSHHGPESLPLPETFKDALIKPSKDVSYVSHTVKAQGDEDDTPSKLDSNNHAFYIGKLMLLTKRQRLKRVLGWKNITDSIYSKEFILASIEHLLSQVRPGQRVQYVVAPAFSELFNGWEDFKKGLDETQEVNYIKRLIKKHFKGRQDDIDVVNVETLPHNQSLFEELRKHQNLETGLTDPAKAYNSTSYALDGNSDALDIARFLYQTKAKNDVLSKVFYGMIPAEIKGELKEMNNELTDLRIQLEDMNSDSETYSNPEERTALQKLYTQKLEDYRKARDHYSCYGLTEVASRLSEVLHGRNIHGGVERQGKYDDLISKIINGKNGSLKRQTDLDPLFDLFEGKRFETIHVTTKESYHEVKKKRNIARTRVSIYSVLAMGILLGAFSTGVITHMMTQSTLDQGVFTEIQSDLKGANIYNYQKWGNDYTSFDKANIFLEIMDEAVQDLALRYSLPGHVVEQLHPFLAEYMLQNKSSLNNCRNNFFARNDIVDNFMAKHKLFLKYHGIEHSKPYKELRSHLGLFQDTAKSTKSIIVNTQVRTQMNPALGSGQNVSESSLEFIGEFRSGKTKGDATWYKLAGKNLPAKHYEFYIYTNSHTQEKTLMAGIGSNRYSSKEAIEGAKQFLYTIHRADWAELSEHNELVSTIRFLDQYPQCQDKDIRDDESFQQFKLGTINDSLTGDEYEYAYGFFSNPSDLGASTRCLFAKTPEDETFTTDRAVEMVQKFEDVTMHAWYDYNRDFYVDDFLPLNFSSILEDLDSLEKYLDFVDESFLSTMASPESPKEIFYARNVIAGIKRDIDNYSDTYSNNRDIINSLEYLKGHVDNVQRHANQNNIGISLDDIQDGLICE